MHCSQPVEGLPRRDEATWKSGIDISCGQTIAVEDLGQTRYDYISRNIGQFEMVDADFEYSPLKRGPKTMPTRKPYVRTLNAAILLDSTYNNGACDNSDLDSAISDFILTNEQLGLEAGNYRCGGKWRLALDKG